MVADDHDAGWPLDAPDVRPAFDVAAGQVVGGTVLFAIVGVADCPGSSLDAFVGEGPRIGEHAVCLSRRSKPSSRRRPGRGRGLVPDLALRLNRWLRSRTGGSVVSALGILGDISGYGDIDLGGLSCAAATG